MIRVAYIGNFAHAHCTEVAVARALELNGCEVFRVQQEDAHDSRTFALDGEMPALVLYTRTHNHTALSDVWTSMWDRLADRGVVTASVHLDRFWDLPREHLIHDGDPLFTTQHVFTADGGNQERFAAAGVNHHWMPPAFDHDPTNVTAFGETERWLPHELPPVNETIDVVFAGTGARHYHPEYPERGKLIDALREKYQDGFVHVGLDGDRPKVHGADLTRLYRSARVVVGDSCFANQGHGEKADRYWSDRVPETLGRGGVLVHAATAGLTGRTAEDARTGDHAFNASHFMPHDAGDFDSLRLMIDLLLANDSLRWFLRDHGRRHVLAEHTWEVRMRDVLGVCGFPAEVGAAE